MKPRVWVNKVTFSDGTSVEFSKDDVIIVVGPNNSGKSASLRAIRDKFNNTTTPSLVLNSIVISREGTCDELIAWLESSSKRIDQANNDNSYQAFGAGVNTSRAKSIWNNVNLPLQELSRFFCHLLTADERLQAANPPSSIAIASQAPQHPIHFLQRDDALEAKLSMQFRNAFGVDMIVHRNAGSQVPIHIGDKPKVKRGQDRVSLAYTIELEKLPTIHTQGDGMRSFAGVLLNTAVGSQTVLLVDEPEAFLHPPQARHLGRMMVKDRQSDRQLFIATHSGDILKGVLDSNSSNVRVIRLRRKGSVNLARELNNSQILEVWKDPLLRYSNILDGLFHEKVVLCESDSDCRFYEAIMDATFEATDNELRKPDIMFTHCGGKSRLPMVIRSLRDLEVPISVVTDFDVLNDEQPLHKIIQAAGGDWGDFKDDWQKVKKAVDAKKPELSTEEVKNELTTILSACTENIFPPELKIKIQNILRRSSPWSNAKSVGVQFIPNGQTTQACERLLANLKSIGVFVVPVGELEGFCKSCGGHGPSWVNEVLEKNLAIDAELNSARLFVKEIVGEP
ncbi:MAG: ATP-dependent nuclease [Methylophilus sp.]